MIPKTLTLYTKKWICGKSPSIDGPSMGKLGCSSGKGFTSLLNTEGYMCCLGQFARQLAPGLSIEGGYPADLRPIGAKGCPEELELLCTEHELIHYTWLNTDFSTDAVGINDDTETTLEEKIDGLKRLCKEYEVELIVDTTTEEPFKTEA